MPPSKFNQIGFCCLTLSDLPELQWVLCLTSSLWGAQGFFPYTVHLHFVHNQHFYPMKGTPAAALALACRVKSCDTGSFLQATFHLQMSGSRITHAGETLPCITPSQELCSCPRPGDFSWRRWCLRHVADWSRRDDGLSQKNILLFLGRVTKFFSNLPAVQIDEVWW